jgi:predicted house-cleaning noncanonical NTP pyrophosphatase (MazG superfamily)
MTKNEKLVRDKIKDLSEAACDGRAFRVAEPAEMRTLLGLKFLEESEEVIQALGHKQELTEELGDCCEVAKTIMQISGLVESNVKEILITSVAEVPQSIAGQTNAPGFLGPFWGTQLQKTGAQLAVALQNNEPITTLLASCFHIMGLIMDVYAIVPSDVRAIQIAKREKKGGFTRRVVLDLDTNPAKFSPSKS